MSQVTLTFHADGEDYAVDFPAAQEALDWYGTVHPYENTLAIKVTKEEASTLLGRDPSVDEWAEKPPPSPDGGGFFVV